MSHSNERLIGIREQKKDLKVKYQKKKKKTEWTDWAIYWTLDNFLKPLATINLPKLSTFNGNFSKGVEIFTFSSEIIFGQLL